MVGHARRIFISLFVSIICHGTGELRPPPGCYNTYMAEWITAKATVAPPLAHPLQAQPALTPNDSAPSPDSDLNSDIVAFARTRLNFHPDPTQESMLRANPHRVILNCGRQWGKSIVCAALAVHRAWTVPNTLVLIVGPARRQGREFVEKCQSMLRNMGVRPVAAPGHENSIALKNGSRIIGIPAREATIRGFSANLLFIDEAAFVPDDIYHVLRPMLGATKGDLWLLSTPNGKQGFFHETWAYQKEWVKFFSPSTQCPRITAKFLEEERNTIGLDKFAREYLCEFQESEDALFSQLCIDRAMDDTIEPPPLYNPWPTQNCH